jgi:glyoxylate reductase
MFLILGTIRQLNPSLLSIRRGNFKKGLGFGHDPTGKTLGILGLGRIGRAVHQRAASFGMKTIYHNRTRSVYPDAGDATYVSFDQLLRTSDVLSIHVPLEGSTKHLIDEEQLRKMKDGAIVINTSRGAVVDEDAMARALEDGKLAAVGLDVYEQEPLVHPSLLKNERALLVPHLGTHTFETLKSMETLAIENAKRAVSRQPLLTVAPEQLKISNET